MSPSCGGLVLWSGAHMATYLVDNCALHVLKNPLILTDPLSGEKQVTSSVIIPVLKQLKENSQAK